MMKAPRQRRLSPPVNLSAYDPVQASDEELSSLNWVLFAMLRLFEV